MAKKGDNIMKKSIQATVLAPTIADASVVQLNSTEVQDAVVKTIKYMGIGVAAVLTFVGAAGITAGSLGIGFATFAGVGAVVGYISANVNAKRGVIITFSKKGSLVSWKQQWKNQLNGIW